MVVAVIGGDARVVFGGYCHGFGRKGFICKKKKILQSVAVLNRHKL